MEFQDDVMSMFTHKNKEGLLYTSCITKKGWIYIGFMYDGGNYQNTIQEAWRGALAEGTLIKCADDLEKNEALFVLHKKDDKKKLSLLYQASLTDVSHLIEGGIRTGVVALQMRGSD